MKTKSKNGNVWQDAYNAIQNLILCSKIKPGEMITEVGMAEQLGIGRTPVREALHKLEQEGLIVTENRRKRVYILTIKEVIEIFDIKMSLESSIAGWAAERGSDNDLKNLQEKLNLMKVLAAEKPDEEQEEEEWFNKWMEEDNQFHHLLFRMADNKKAEQIILNLNKQWHRLKVGILTMEGRIERSVVEHATITEAVLNRDVSGACDAMRTHLNNLKRMLVKMLKVFHYPEI